MKKKFAVLFCSALMVGSLSVGAVLANATETGTPNEQNVSDVTRVSSYEGFESLASDFYTEFTLTKDGTGSESVTYSGLVPYGTGTISLGTYDMTQTTNLETPLFTILPHKEWSSGDATSASDERFFYVDLTSGNKKVTFRFGRASRTDANQPAVFIGSSDDTVKARKTTNPALYGVDYPLTVLPYRYDGTKVSSSVSGETKNEITAPTPIGFYMNNNVYYMDAFYKTTKTAVDTVMRETSSGSGIYRYSMSNFETDFTAEELKNVSVSVRFDKGTVAKEEAWAMFTSIAGKKTLADYAPEGYLDGGDVFAINENQTTIELNKKISIADNDALTKLVEVQTVPAKGATAEIKDVVVTLQGDTHSLLLRLTKTPDQETTQMVWAWKGNEEDVSVWYAEQRGQESKNITGSSVTTMYAREFGYWFDGVVGNNDNVDEKGNAITKGSVVTPRFAMYYDAATNMLYTDVGRSSSAKGQVTVGDVYRYRISNIASQLGEETVNAFEQQQLQVSVSVTMADGVDSTYLKITDVDGQNLARATATTSSYQSVYHSYIVDGDVEDTFVGAEYTIPELKDYGILNEFATADGYTVKINGEAVENKNIASATKEGENTIEYLVEDKVVGTVEFTAENLGITFIHRGASIRFKGTDEYENGIRFMVAMKKTDVETLSSYNVTAGILSVPTDRLGQDDILNIEMLNDESKKAKNKTFDIETEWNDVTIEGVEYIQMVVYVHNIPDTDYATSFTTRGYLCVNGVYIYTDAVSRSMSWVAKQCVEDADVSQDVKDAVRKYIVD